MLQSVRPIEGDDTIRTWDQDRRLSEIVDFDGLLAAFRRQLRVISLCVMASLVLGVAYVVTAVPLYTAGTNILVDQNSVKLVEQLSQVAATDVSGSEIQSQVEILRSENLALAVVDALNLTDHPLFLRPDFSVGDWLRSKLRGDNLVAGWFRKMLKPFPYFSAWVVPEEEPTREMLRLGAKGRLMSDRNVSRVGDSFVLNVVYTSEDPELAAQIANAFADAYLKGELASKYETTRNASDWLATRIEEIRQKSLSASSAAQQYRADHGLLAGNDGQLLTDQQLSEVSSQLILAQAATAEAAAKRDRIQSILDSGESAALVSDALLSSVITDLRTKYLSASRVATEITAAFGPLHQVAVRSHAQMDEIERQIHAELERIAEGYDSEYQVAKTREDALRNSLASASGVSVSANQQLAELRELEQAATSYGLLYGTLLQRHQNAIEQQSFPVTEARVITSATVPSKPSHPRKSMVLALAGVLGLALGGLLGSYREFRDSYFRTGDQVREELRLDFLGFTTTLSRQDIVGPTEPDPDPRKISSTPGFVIKHPRSLFAETLRSAKLSADITFAERRPIVIGMVSVLPGEGKSLLAVNFAEFLANQGSRTLLIDGDLRSRGLTRSLAPHATAGLVECILAGVPISDVLLTSRVSNLSILPTATRDPLADSSERLSSPGMTSVLAQARSSFDHIIIDLPPIAPVVDVRAIAPKIDAFILVTEWGKTAREVVRATLLTEPVIAGKCLGVILNKVNMKKLKLYRDYGSKEYYMDKFRSYYATSA